MLRLNQKLDCRQRERGYKLPRNTEAAKRGLVIATSSPGNVWVVDPTKPLRPGHKATCLKIRGISEQPETIPSGVAVLLTRRCESSATESG